MQMGSVDRISELPEFILHTILSFLDTKEGCRVTVLSKYWYAAWSSTPVLDFRPFYSEDLRQYGDELDEDEVEDLYDNEAGKRFIECIDETMQRYFEQKHRISKLYLWLPRVDEKIEHLVDKWIGIAVHNHVKELSFRIDFLRAPYYRLPEIIFSAKSLKVLNCVDVHLPYYETMDLSSLESLTLMRVTVDTDMLQRIVTFCPLIDLTITTCGHDEISLPWVENGFETARSFGGGSVQSNVRTSLLRRFVYCGELEFSLWSWNINVGALRNLRTVEINDASITDGVVFQLASGLVALECLILDLCFSLRHIQISSKSLKEFHIMRGSKSLEKITIDAPNLLEFGYNGLVDNLETSVFSVNAHDSCNSRFIPSPDFIFTSWFLRLKTFLLKTNIFKSLVMDFAKCCCGQIDVKELSNISSCAPYVLRELKLQQFWSGIDPLLIDLLDGLFWSCHPDVVSITTAFQSSSTELILNFLKDKVQCLNHPLKSIEVEGADLSSLLTPDVELEIRFRLSWKSF